VDVAGRESGGRNWADCGPSGKQIPWGRPGAATTGSCACSRSSTALRTSPISSIRDADDGSELIGRPLGDEAFLDAISLRLNRVVTPA
jgi:hypothetical protein